jgi:nucleoside-diphosphate-sugar epimerase/pimeloyl-ACP methyl ester carboxylesterase
MKNIASTGNGDAGEVLVTGATGLIGRWLLAALTQRGQVAVALVRDAARRESELRAFVERIGGDGARLRVVEGDVEREGLGLSEALPKVRVVHHLAARFAFGLSVEDARRTNVEGTRNVIAWAARQPCLDRFVFLGGYRMTKVSLASLDDARLREAYASGAYEGSKVEAYALFRALADHHGLSWTAVHPSGLIGDSRTGETTQLVGIGETVKRLFEGRLPALAGSARTFVPVVTVDFLADYLATVPARAASAGKDLVVLDPASPPLGELVAKVARHLGVTAPARTLPLGLVAALPSAWTGLDRESLSFLSEDRYDTTEGDAHAAAMGLVHPPIDQALARWCDHLVSTRFLGAAVKREPGRFVDGTFTVGDPKAAEVVLLHGIPFDSEAMGPLARRLERSAARVDLPGLGRSAAGRAIDPAWLDGVLGARRRPVILIGHSLGAALAVRYAAAHPEKVRALVLIAPAFLAKPGSWTLRWRPMVASVLGGLTPDAFERRFVATEASVSAEPSDATRDACAALARKGGARRYADALADAVSPAVRAAALDAFGAVQARGIPVSIVHARREPLVHDVRGADVTCVEDAGHNPHVTHTEEVARVVRAFVAGLEPAGAARRQNAMLA